MKITLRFITVLLFVMFSRYATGDMPTTPPIPKPKGQEIDVAMFYVASGWMGDGEEGTQFVNLNEVCEEDPRSVPTCQKITYTIGPKNWAGMYWLNKPNNWGDKPGEDLSKFAYSKVSFWAKGDKGGEVVEFKAGGVDSKGKPYKDSFEVTTGKVRLERDWKRYEIDLTGRNLSSVIGFFCWVASGTANPNGLTFYLDDIYYE